MISSIKYYLGQISSKFKLGPLLDKFLVSLYIFAFSN